jgi:hypothetical protein
MPNPSIQLVNHFHRRTTIEGSTHTFGMPQQTTTSMFGQGYTYTTPNFSMTNPGSASHTSGYTGRAYPNSNDNYQAPYTTVAYTDPILLASSSLCFLPNHAYQNVTRFNAYDQLEADGFDYETPPQFPFSPQSIDMMLSWAAVKPDADPNNLTNQLAIILREYFVIELKGRGHIYQKYTLITITSSPTL